MRLNTALWIVQTLLAALFLFAGSMKLVLPVEAMAGPVALPGPFLRFIGVAEVLGGVGLILPWLLKIRPVLTPVAAGGLVIIMIGATVLTALTGSIAPALFPLTVGLLASSIVYGRGFARRDVAAGLQTGRRPRLSNSSPLIRLTHDGTV
jgi:hypothetical protein